MNVTRIALLGLALGLTASSAHALIDVNAFGGYATLGMGDINNAIDGFASANSGSATHINSGFYVGADGTISLLPFLSVGPRLEYLQAGEGKVTIGGNAATIDANLMKYELGVRAGTSLPLTGLSVSAGLWGGYGMASGKVDSSAVGGSAQTGTGGAFVGELEASAKYKLVAGLSLGVDVGYRMASVSTINGSNGQDLIQTNSGSNAAWDFSGLKAGLSLGWGF